MTAARLVARAVTRGVAQHRILEEVSLAAEPGDIVLVTGRSGSGKTTLLALLGGWIPPDSGTVVFDAAPIGVPSWSRVAIVPQTFALVGELTAFENVVLARHCRDGDDAELVAREWLARLDLTTRADALPDELSSGQQQRVALARALAVDPSVLLADEPTSHQDHGHVDVIRAALRAAADRGTACVVVTHDARLQSLATKHIELGGSH